jgi:hypothetical protein
VRVPLFEVDGWRCEWNARRGTHTFTRPGSQPIVIRSNATIPLRTDTDPLPRFAAVERTWTRRTLPYRLKGYDNPLSGYGDVGEGGEQGGQDIELHPKWEGDRTIAELDGVIERHPVCAFDFTTGAPLTREQLGYDFVYRPIKTMPGEGDTLQLPPFVRPVPPNHPCARWQRYDPAHLIRGYAAAVAAWRERRDIVAFWWLQVVDNDVRLSYADRKVKGGYWSLAEILENTRTWAKGSAQLGEIRAHAWSLRAVVEATRARMQARSIQDGRAVIYPDPEHPSTSWIKNFVEMVLNAQAANGALASNFKTSGEEMGIPWKDWQPYTTSNRQFNAILHENETELPAWQVPFLLRALYEAQDVIREEVTTARVREIVRRWMRVYRTCELIPSGYDHTHKGLPKYIVVARDGALLPTLSEGIGAGITEYEGDAFDVARRLGVRV